VAGQTVRFIGEAVAVGNQWIFIGSGVKESGEMKKQAVLCKPDSCATGIGSEKNSVMKLTRIGCEHQTAVGQIPKDRITGVGLIHRMRALTDQSSQDGQQGQRGDREDSCSLQQIPQKQGQ